MNSLTEVILASIKDIDIDRCSVEKSKDDRKVIKVKKDDKVLYIGSKYAVKRDLDNFINEVKDYNVNTIFLVFGLGTGQHIIELLKKISNTNKVIIVEPDEEIILLNKDSKDFKTIIDDKRVTLTTMDDFYMQLTFQNFIEEFNAFNVNVMSFANYSKIYDDAYYKLCHKLKGYVDENILNINTDEYFSKTNFSCFMDNIKYIAESSIINSTKDIYKDIPAVIVSAGPSLSKNIEELKKIKGKFLILTGGRTLRALKQVNVDPDLVAVVDPGKWSYFVMEDSFDCTSPLVFCQNTNADVVKSYKGDKIFFREYSGGIDYISDIIGKKADNLYQGGSVAHTCLAVADYMGCNPIMFIGQDLAYTDNKAHADIATTSYEVYDDDTIYVDDIYGNKVKTTNVFNLYRGHIERFIEYTPGKEFINCTEGGANIKGTKVMDFEDAINKYATEKYFNNEILSEILKQKLFDKDAIRNKLEMNLEYIKEIKKECEKAIIDSKELYKYYDENYKINEKKILKGFSLLNEKIQKLNLISSLLKPTMHRVLMTVDFMEVQNETQREKGIKLSKQSECLYSGISKAIDEAVVQIQNSIESLK